MNKVELADQKITDGMINAEIETHNEAVIKGELIKLTYEVTITNHSNLNLGNKVIWFKLNNAIPRIPDELKTKFKNGSIGDVSIVQNAISDESGEGQRFKGSISQLNKGEAKKVTIFIFVPVRGEPPTPSPIPFIESILIGDTPTHMGGIVDKVAEDEIIKHHVNVGALLFEKKFNAELVERDNKKSLSFATSIRLISRAPIYNEPTIIFGIYAHKNERLQVNVEDDKGRPLHGTYEQQYFHGMEFFDLKIKRPTSAYGDINEKITSTLALVSKAMQDKYLASSSGYEAFVSDYSIHFQFVGVNVLISGSGRD